MIVLQPIAMVRPTAAGIYAPSRLQPRRTISEAAFLEVYADHPHQALVSFAPDGYSNPETVTVYGFGFDAWYIVAERLEPVT